jgi:hypothetical protein
VHFHRFVGYGRRIDIRQILRGFNLFVCTFGGVKMGKNTKYFGDANEQELVSTFIRNKVPDIYRNRFLYLMAEWDGSNANSVLYSYYDKSVLLMKLNEAMEDK